MANVDKLVEIGAVVLQVFQSVQELFEKNNSNDVLSVGDSLMFLTTKTLGFSSSGSLNGNFAKIGNAILQISELCLIAIVLFFAFRCLFSYLVYKKQVLPWRFFIRIIVVGILAMGAYYLCFGAVFFTENITGYIRSYLGEENISFEILNKRVEKLDFKMTGEEEVINLADTDNVINICAHFSTVFVSISMGIRYFLLEILILFSPVFILFAGFEDTQPIFMWWLKVFGVLLSCQLFIAVLLGVFSFQTFNSDKIKIILLVSCLMLITKINQICIKKEF